MNKWISNCFPNEHFASKFTFKMSSKNFHQTPYYRNMMSLEMQEQQFPETQQRTAMIWFTLNRYLVLESFKLKLSKYNVAKSQIDFPNYEISNGQVNLDNSNTETTHKIISPQNYRVSLDLKRMPEIDLQVC